MKHGIFYAYWVTEWNADFCYYMEKVANLGFDILEIAGGVLPDYTEEELAELKACAQKNNLTLTCGYGPAPEHNIATDDMVARQKALEWYERLFKALKYLDIHMLCGALYSYWPVDYSKGVDKEKDWANSVAGMKELGALAAKYDVKLGMEVLNRFENHILNTAAEAVDYVEQVGLDNVKIHLDTFHMNIEEVSIGDAIRTAGKHLGHMHTGECNRMVPGMGRTPWHEVSDALHDIGYEGALVMEPFVIMGGQAGADIKIWRPMRPTTDEATLDNDVKKALEFQHFMFDHV